ncbi:HNH endonuclease [Streptomyces sp. NPDC102451]|uniref:HNH endonuclease n=1 Tax=Streptomyces sp. NPDC102451 TaxID=3366177 RepID=UPI0038287ADA
MPSGAWQALQRAYGAVCGRPECGATQDLALDHVIPLSLGGRDDLTNAQILCRSCNSGKRNWNSADYRIPDNGILVDTITT